MADKVDVYGRERLAVFAMTEWESKDKRKSGTRFTQIGGASVNRDGSINLYLDLLPAQGQTCQLRSVKQWDDRPATAPSGPDGSGVDESSGQPF